MNDRQFNRAHEQYLTPPEDNTDVCPECDGDGYLTDASGEKEPCRRCEGEGNVNTKAEAIEAWADEEERRAEQRRDEPIFEPEQNG